MKHVLVSACLLGMPCRYDGRSKPAALTELSRAAALVPFCPEIYGGLPTPAPVRGAGRRTREDEERRGRYRSVPSGRGACGRAGEGAGLPLCASEGQKSVLRARPNL